MADMETLSMSDDGGSPLQQRNTSRRKKSAAQVECLERMYAENKYPSEEARAKMSVQLGLSEKQMQVWFTHKRHKERKEGVEDVKLTFYAMRHKGGEAHLDFMEELNSGKRMGGSLVSSGDTPPTRGHQAFAHSGGEAGNERNRKTDSSSENSGLGEADELTTNGSKLSMKRGSLISRKERIYKRPTALLPRSQVDAKNLELAVVAAVEAQLGSSIRPDGPLLGMEFDTIPPNAWAHLSNSQTAVPMEVQGLGMVRTI